MRFAIKCILAGSGLITFGGFLVLGGVLSIPRDYSTPSASITIIDQKGAPIDGIEVSRYWYDSDCGTEGCDRAVADQPTSQGISAGKDAKYFWLQMNTLIRP
jgi:hypothetical protein